MYKLEAKNKKMMHNYRRMCYALECGEISQRGFLDMLYNLAGPFKAQWHVKGEQPRRQHDWLKAREWPGYRVNHRCICESELVFDIDIPGWMTRGEREIILKASLRRLREQHDITPVVFDTGKGYHCHWFSQDIARVMTMANGEREFSYIKRRMCDMILKDVRTDLMKWNHRTTIAIECSPHWKRGNKIKLMNI